MALTITVEEDYKDSREVNITEDSFDQTFIFYICGNLLEEADVDATYGPDDDLVALEAAYSIIPPWRRVPTYSGDTLILTLSSIAVKMLAHDHWRITVSYGVPNSGGQSGGGYSANPGNVGPGADDYKKWSDTLVQLNFNVSAEMSNMQISLGTLACQKNKAAANQQVPWPVNRPAPIGLTVDGVEGTDKYVRQFEFGITCYFPPAKLTFPYVRRLYRMCTTLNDNTFFGFPRGSVLFLESDAAGDVFSVVPVNFNFKVRPNFKFTDVQANSGLMDPNADSVELMFDTYYEPFLPPAQAGPEPGGAYSGWSVVDYQYLDKEEQGVLVQEPNMRTIHRVYSYSNFDRLEL